MINNKPNCFCLTEYEGNPPEVPCTLPQKPCDPSPCGPNTQCTVLSNGFAKCTCLPGYIESPNTIRGCMEQIDACNPNPCGLGAICDSSRNPVCYCPEPYIGNPFTGCQSPFVYEDLCKPGPCGRNADCYAVNNREECYCKDGYIGDPYYECREPPRSPCQPNPCGPGAVCVVSRDGNSICNCPPGKSGDPSSSTGCQSYECQIDGDCANHLACIGYRCVDPCPGSCGIGASCKVEHHHPVCFCDVGLSGNPAIYCSIEHDPPKRSPCSPSPCGINTKCEVVRNRAVCSCLPEYQGDPKKGCRPECVINSDCSNDKACVRNKCINPCDGTICGIDAICKVDSHLPSCECPKGFMGSPYYQCTMERSKTNITYDPCQPSPCGPQSYCTVFGDGIAVCDPCAGPNAYNTPNCRPECLSNIDCPFDKACFGQKCNDPCPGSCGHMAECTVINHSPTCKCPIGMVGNPFEFCKIPIEPEVKCNTVTCGANTECKMQNGALGCICKKGYYGDPLIGCRPECVISTDCPSNKACINNKCDNPCVGTCGIEALCEVINHYPVCHCPNGYTGDASISCMPIRQPPPYDVRPYNPCEPNPCGANSRCLLSNDGHAVCSCLPGYRGYPPLCQPECITSSDCSPNRACIAQRCNDPCPGTCGINAYCEVINHNPICSCPQNYGGDPFVSCNLQDPVEFDDRDDRNPCSPSPCGPNSICQIKRGRPVCSCVENFIGSPPHCRPECVISTECPTNKACIREKCEDPCKNICGTNAECKVVAHSAYCSCKSGFEGDAFVGCTQIPKSECSL